MKKRAIKDFISLYHSDDEEKLVLIQSYTIAGRSFMDNFWTASTPSLAMVDVKTGHIILIPEYCSLCWPMTDKEQKTGEYSKRFTKGTIYRIKARARKDTERCEHNWSWYVTEVLEEDVSCPTLKKVWDEYIKPVIIEDEILGTLTLNKEMSTLDGTYQWMGKEVQISLDVNSEDKSSWSQVRNVMKEIIKNEETWDKTLRTFAAKNLTNLANEWLENNDQTSQTHKKEPITEVQFGNRIKLEEFAVSPSGYFNAWYEDDDMLWDHSVVVEAKLKKGPLFASIQG